MREGNASRLNPFFEPSPASRRTGYGALNRPHAEKGKCPSSAQRVGSPVRLRVRLPFAASNIKVRFGPKAAAEVDARFEAGTRLWLHLVQGVLQAITCMLLRLIFTAGATLWGAWPALADWAPFLVGAARRRGQMVKRGLAPLAGAMPFAIRAADQDFARIGAKIAAKGGSPRSNW